MRRTDPKITKDNKEGFNCEFLNKIRKRPWFEFCQTIITICTKYTVPLTPHTHCHGMMIRSLKVVR